MRTVYDCHPVTLQDALRTLWKDYFLSCHGIVYVVDSEDEDRLLDSRDVFLKVCIFYLLEF